MIKNEYKPDRIRFSVRELDFIISRNLARLRRESGLSKAELEEKTGVSQERLERFEPAGGASISMVLCWKLAGAYGMSLSTFVGELLRDTDVIVEREDGGGML